MIHLASASALEVRPQSCLGLGELLRVLGLEGELLLVLGLEVELPMVLDLEGELSMVLGLEVKILGTGPPFPGSAIPGVRHSHGPGIWVRVRVTVRVRVRVKVRQTVGMADPGNGGPESSS